MAAVSSEADASGSSALQLSRPPIVEAIVDIQLQNGTSADQAVLISSGLSAYYSLKDRVPNYAINIVDGAVDLAKQSDTLRLNGVNSSELAIIHSTGFAISQLPPYAGWENLVSRMRRDWPIVSSAYGEQRVNRLAARYLNKIDIPLIDGVADYEEYIDIYPKLPSSMPLVSQFVLSTTLALQEFRDLSVVVQSSTMPQTAPDVMSIMLDIDVGYQTDMAFDWQLVEPILTRIRHAKNLVFSELVFNKALERYL